MPIRKLGGDVLCAYTSGGPFGVLLDQFLDKESIEKAPLPIDGWTRESLMVYETPTNDQYRFSFPDRN
ncbi:MAG: hypothetical protein U5R49_27020 [Deltaproteobacteria bacterium]|nr:hypothetical protein [Deltaproteobacteria bacterium]